MENVKESLWKAAGGLIVWGFRLLVIGVFFWLKSEFVTKDSYLENQGKQLEQWMGLTKTLQHIDDVLVTLDKHDDDQEKRIRELEKKR